MAEETAVVTQLPENKSKKIRLVVLPLLGIVILAVVLVIIHQVNPTFSIAWVIGLPGGLLVLGIIVFVISEIINKVRKKMELKEKGEIIPKAASPEQIESKVREYFLTNKENHVRNITFVRPKTPNKNEIYTLEVELYYPYVEGDIESRKVFVIVNANYLNSRAIIIQDINSSSSKISNIMNEHSLNPNASPDVEIEKSRNLLTGTEITRKKKIYDKKLKSEIKKPSGELN